MLKLRTNGFAKVFGFALLAIVVCAGPTSAQINWTDGSNPPNQNWNDPANWSGGDVPGVGAFIDENANVPSGPQIPLSPIQNIDVTLNNLTISDDSVVQMGPPDGVAMTLDGNTLSGDFQMANAGGPTTKLIIDGSVTYNSAPLAALNMSNNSAITGNGTLINQAAIHYSGGGTSPPVGYIGKGLTVQNQNDAVISSGVTNASFTLYPNANWINDGLIESQEGPLNIKGGTINQGTEGELLGNVNGGTVNLYNEATIVGGSLVGAIIGCRAVLHSLTITGTYTTGAASGCQPPFSTELEGTITNNGSISVQSSTGNFSDLTMGGFVTLTGSGSVLLGGTNAVINGLGLTNQQTISGVGQIVVGDLTNAGPTGTISAAGGTLTIEPSGSTAVTNTGTLTAAPSCTLVISDTTVNNTGGSIVPAAGGIVKLFFATVDGGTVSAVDLLDATLNGPIDVGGDDYIDEGEEATVKGNVNGPGTLNVGNNTGSSATLNAESAGFFGLDIVLVSNNNANQIAGTGLTIGKGSSLTGNGLVNSTTVKFAPGSSTNCTLDSSPLQFGLTTTVTLQGGAVLSSPTTCPIWILGPLTNYNASTNTLTGGTWTLSGPLVLATGTNITDLAATMTLNPGWVITAGSTSGPAALNLTTIGTGGSLSLGVDALYEAPSSLTVETGGALTIDSGASFDLFSSGADLDETGGAVTNNGAIYLSESGFVNITGGTFADDGLISGSVSLGSSSNDGVKRAASHSQHASKSETSSGTPALIVGGKQQAGTATISQNYTQFANGAIDVQIGGTTAGTQYSQLNVTGTATLSGTLNITRIDKFLPQVGQVFIIMNASEGITGTFSTVNGLSINKNEHFSIAYSSDGITLTVESGP